MNCSANSDTATSDAKEVKHMDIGTILIAAGMILGELLDDDEDH